MILPRERYLPPTIRFRGLMRPREGFASTARGEKLSSARGTDSVKSDKT